MYRIQQFANLAGVTVRALHHYDRLGLLSPRNRSEAGYRLYENEDLGRLERILVLRYLGLSLREVAELLDRGGDADASLAATFTRQAMVLRARRDGIARVLHAVNRALSQTLANSGEGQNATPDWQLYQSILKEMQMQEDQNWTEKYYSPEAREAIDAKRGEWTPELQAKITADWQRMYADVQAALDRGVEPKSEEGKALADRWMVLVGQFTGGNPKVLAGLNKLYEDRPQWPSKAITAEQHANMPSPEHMAFVRAAQSTE